MLTITPGGGSFARIPLATKYAGVSLGDSLTSNTTYLTPADYYPPVLNKALQQLGCSVAILNNGQSGYTTGEVLVRARLQLPAVSGTICSIYAGTNDQNNPSTVQASPSPTTTTFSVASGKGAGFPVNTSLTINGVSVGNIASRATDAITLTTPMASPPVAGQAVMQDTTQNLIDTSTTMTALGYTRQLMGVMEYLNYTSGGDTLSAQQSLALITRTAQLAAISSLGNAVVAANFYLWMRNLIVTGVDTQGSFSWHVADGNPHNNIYGEQIYCDCLLSLITAAGWLPALRT